MTVNFYYPKQLVKKRNILIGLILLGLSIIILLGKVLEKIIEFGGTGIFASWKLLYQEDVFKNGNWRKQCQNFIKTIIITPVKMQKNSKTTFTISIKF